jgi:type IV pilus assembly protein PilM
VLSLFDGTIYPIGLDLGADSIKMIQLESTRGGLCVRAAGHYSFPPELNYDSPEREELAINAVKQMLKKNGFKGRKVVSALPDNDMVIKTLRLPPGNEDSEETIMTEAAKKLPFDINSAQVQYLNAGKVQQGDEPFTEIILLAARNEDIQSEIEFLARMSLEPQAIDAGPCALFRGFERFLQRSEDTNEVSLIVDIGAAHTKVTFGHGAELVFIKVINLGSRNISQAVSQNLGLSLPEAAKLRNRLCDNQASTNQEGLDGKDELAQEVLTASWPALTELAREISLCIRYHAVTFRGYRPKNLKLSGGEANFQETCDFLSQALSLPVEPAHPLKFMNTAAVDLVQSRRKPAPVWAVGTGLALRGQLKPQNRKGAAA